MYIAETKPMPMRAFLLYIKAKETEKHRWENYITDCLWVQAVGRTFSDKNNNATFPRWHEIVNPQKNEPKAQITKQDVKAQFLRLKTQ